MENAPAKELLKKIQELEVGQAHLVHEMCRLKQSGEPQLRTDTPRRRSNSISPQRPRLAANTRSKGSTSFRHASPLQRESRTRDNSPSALPFTDKQYLNILQSMGQGVHLMDTNGRLLYWSVLFKMSLLLLLFYGFS